MQEALLFLLLFLIKHCQSEFSYISTSSAHLYKKNAFIRYNLTHGDSSDSWEEFENVIFCVSRCMMLLRANCLAIDVFEENGLIKCRFYQKFTKSSKDSSTGYHLSKKRLNTKISHCTKFGKEALCGPCECVEGASSHRLPFWCNCIAYQRTINSKPTNCKDALSDAVTPSKIGIYEVTPYQTPMKLLCRKNNEKVRFTIMRRRQGSVFPVDMTSYLSGFANGVDNYWVGLDILHDITHKHRYNLRVRALDDKYIEHTLEYGNFTYEKTTKRVNYLSFHSIKGYMKNCFVCPQYRFRVCNDVRKFWFGKCFVSSYIFTSYTNIVWRTLTLKYIEMELVRNDDPIKFEDKPHSCVDIKEQYCDANFENVVYPFENYQYITECFFYATHTYESILYRGNQEIETPTMQQVVDGYRFTHANFIGFKRMAELSKIYKTLSLHAYHNNNYDYNHVFYDFNLKYFENDTIWIHYSKMIRNISYNIIHHHETKEYGDNALFRLGTSKLTYCSSFGGGHWTECRYLPTSKRPYDNTLTSYRLSFVHNHA